MNQKWLVLLLALLLCGCRNPEPPAEAGAVSVPAIAVTEPTDSVGFYFPDSPMEAATEGAIKAFPLGLTDCTGIRFLGEDILLFSGSDATALTLLSGENRYVDAHVQLSCAVFPQKPSVRVDARGVSYVDSNSRMLVTLNHLLEEVSRIPLPDGCVSAALSSNRQLLYYCSNDALRVLNLETGMDRLLREMRFPVQELTALHCGDSVIRCDAQYSDGSNHSLFISADTGILLYEGTAELQLWTEADFYIARHVEDSYPEWLTGNTTTSEQLLVLESDPSIIEPIPAAHSLLTYCQTADSAWLECYELDSGSLYAQVNIPNNLSPRSVQRDPSNGTLWFLSFDSSSEQEVLYVWAPESAPTSEEKTYLQTRWVRETPDMDGLAQCSLLAQRIGFKHGVRILIWTDSIAYEPKDYTLTAEYQVPLLQRRLNELDTALSCFPEEFLEEAASQTGSGRLTICLVRSINGNASNSVMSLQYWDEDARAYLAIPTTADVSQHLYRELFHIFDSRILSTCNTYDDWNKLNPKGFSYDPDYTSTHSEEGRGYLTEENRYFVDLYSMTYPKEDRARIMEYAMLDGQEELFRASPMQAKLRRLCQGIRKCFGLEKEPVVYRWEQYLEDPLMPSA